MYSGGYESAMRIHKIPRVNPVSYTHLEHSVEDKADFLKREYGMGGRSHALSDAPGSDESHDAKGMELKIGRAHV